MHICYIVVLFYMRTMKQTFSCRNGAMSILFICSLPIFEIDAIKWNTIIDPKSKLLFYSKTINTENRNVKNRTFNDADFIIMHFSPRTGITNAVQLATLRSIVS